jgi:predicted PhzF superfamily epimerase YddE/YHI9
MSAGIAIALFVIIAVLAPKYGVDSREHDPNGFVGAPRRPNAARRRPGQSLTATMAPSRLKGLRPFTIRDEGSQLKRFTIVDAFASEPFAGNPAAVCQLTGVASATWMHAVAAELALPMTAFVKQCEDGTHDLRWFNAGGEAKLCGHATLAAAHVLGGTATFRTAVGLLTCEATNGGIEMRFPAGGVQPLDDASPWAHIAGVDAAQIERAYESDEWRVLQVDDARLIARLTPQHSELTAAGVTLLTVAFTNCGDDVDSVCRVFNPTGGAYEDAVTGSAHCIVGPLLAAATGRTQFVGVQASPRGGRIGMRVDGGDVYLSGTAVTVAEGALCRDI